MTTQNLRALIARLQARLGGLCPMGEPPFIHDYYSSGGGTNGYYVVPEMWDEDSGVTFADCETYAGDEDNARNRAALIAATLNELPAQIARWLKRLDEADRAAQAAIEASQDNQFHYSAALQNQQKADTLLATVTEDVQAWAVRLGVGDG